MRSWLTCPVARVARWSRSREIDGLIGRRASRRGREFELRIMVPQNRNRIDDWWNPGSIAGFNEASLGRDRPKRILEEGNLATMPKHQAQVSLDNADAVIDALPRCGPRHSLWFRSKSRRPQPRQSALPAAHLNRGLEYASW